MLFTVLFICHHHQCFDFHFTFSPLRIFFSSVHLTGSKKNQQHLEKEEVEYFIKREFIKFNYKNRIEFLFFSFCLLLLIGHATNIYFCLECVCSMSQKFTKMFSLVSFGIKKTINWNNFCLEIWMVTMLMMSRAAAVDAANENGFYFIFEYST